MTNYTASYIKRKALLAAYSLLMCSKLLGMLFLQVYGRTR